MTRAWRRVATGLAVATLLAGVAGCGGRAFSADDTLRITSPTPLSTVTAPFTVSWETPPAAGTAYAVFVDRLPIAPGHTLRDVALEQCRREPTCYPDKTYLESLGIFLSERASVKIPSLPTASGVDGHEDPPLHTLSVVQFSASAVTGHRIGESAVEVEFRGV